MAETVEDQPPLTTEEKQAELLHKIAQANLHYAHKSYENAAELYAEAAGLQAELNGELALENADLLYRYGRCLYHVGVSKSDVLGGKVAGEKRGKKRKKAPAEAEAEAKTDGEPTVAEKVLEAVVEEKQEGEENAAVDEAPASKKTKTESTPYFQIEGDGADWTSESEDEEADGEDTNANDDGAVDEEEDDFANAYEILDLARVLLLRKLEEASSSENADSADERKVKETLADTHDLQAEISLENERFPEAVAESQASLALKQELYPLESNFVAEAHFKVALALEFASVTQAPDGEEPTKEVAGVDEEMRKEAAKHMEDAIASTKLRVQRETTAMQAMEDAGEKQEQQRRIEDVQGLIDDMEQRLVELREPTISLKGPSGPAGAGDDANPLGGILGSLLGESAASQKARIDEATKSANDLTGLVRQKKKKPDQPSTETATATEKTEPAALNGNGKRTLEVVVDGHGDASADGGAANGTKKAKVEDSEAV